MKAKTTWHRLLSTLLCLVMVMGLLPTVAFAEGTLPTPKNLTWDGSKAKWEYTSGDANVEGATAKLYNTKYSDAIIQVAYQNYTGFTEWDVAKYLLPGETYKFEVIVKERYASNTTSAMSATLTMSSDTFAPTSVTNLQLGANGAMTWDEVPYATEYAAKLFEYRDNQWFCTDENKISGRETSYTWPENNFTPGEKYKAKLEAKQGSMIVGTAIFSNEYTHTGSVHTHAADTSAWKRNDDYHWRECSCGLKIFDTMAAHTYGADDKCTVCGLSKNTFPQPTNLQWDGTTAKWEYPNDPGVRRHEAYFYLYNVKYPNKSIFAGGCGYGNNYSYYGTEYDFAEALIPGETYYFEIELKGSTAENSTTQRSTAISPTKTITGTYEPQDIRNLTLSQNGKMTWTGIEYQGEYRMNLYRIENDGTWTLVKNHVWSVSDKDDVEYNWGASLFEAGKTYVASLEVMQRGNVRVTNTTYSNEYNHVGSGTTYAVTFEGGEGATGSAPTMPNQPEGAKFKLPSNTFTKAGCEFLYWSDGTSNWEADRTEYTMPAQPVTFTAVWSGTALHTCAPELVPQKAATCKEAGNVAYYKCECGNLYTDAAGTSPTTLDAVTIAENANNHVGARTLKHNDTQHWYEWDCCHALDGEKADHTPGDWIIDTPATATTDGIRHRECSTCHETTETDTVSATGYTITFDANGGTCDTPSVATGIDGKLATLPTPTRSGRYDFDGWFDAQRGGNKITTDTIFTENTTVYAHWTYTGGGSGGGGGTVLPIYHTIKATAGVGGSISPDGTKSLLNGGSQTYTITPDSGYQISDVKVDGRSVGAVKTYTFRNVNENHTIQATFEKVKDNPNTGAFPFVDVGTSDWFFGDVAYVYDHDLMNGTSDTTFAPNLTTSRAMIVTILYRLEGEPAVYGTSSFSDVEKNTWYSKAVVWAEQNGIVKGYDNGKFGVNDDITREQLAAILYRYMQFKGMDAVTMSEHLTSFSDHEQVSGYAVQAMNWAVANNLISGADNKLMPTDGATRAQVAAILHRFCENVLK